MGDIIYKQLEQNEVLEFQNFCETHWGSKHPLIHDSETFDYYFVRENTINIMCARDKDTNELLSLAGFIKTNDTKTPDIFISYLVAKKGAPITAALKTVDEIKKQTGCSTASVNNIRPSVFGFYKFLKFNVKPLNQFYRLNDSVEKYTLCSISDKIIPKVQTKGFKIKKVSQTEFLKFDFSTFNFLKPYKDLSYIKWRYLENPWFEYSFIRITKKEKTAFAVYRVIISDNDKKALRFVDFIGNRELITALGGATEILFDETGAEFADFSAIGFSEQTMFEAGFVLRTTDDQNIVPVYLTPLELSNVDFFSASNMSGDWVMFKADGDQDRFNLSL